MCDKIPRCKQHKTMNYSNHESHEWTRIASRFALAGGCAEYKHPGGQHGRSDVQKSVSIRANPCKKTNPSVRDNAREYIKNMQATPIVHKCTPISLSTMAVNPKNRAQNRAQVRALSLPSAPCFPRKYISPTDGHR